MISEESSKKHRGRPRIYSDTERSRFLAERRTERGCIEWWIGIRAFKLIHDAWTADRAANAWAAPYFIDEADKKFPHKSVMAALGRIEDDQTILAFARQIAEAKLSTKAAVAAVRRFRLGTEPKGGILSLIVRLEVTINDWLATHPSMGLDSATRALRELADLIDDRDADMDVQRGAMSETMFEELLSERRQRERIRRQIRRMLASDAVADRALRRRRGPDDRRLDRAEDAAMRGPNAR